MGNRLFLHRRNRNITLVITFLLIAYAVLFEGQQTLFVALLLVNSYAFLLMGSDKRAAKKGDMRIPEASLFSVAVLGGAAGIGLGMLFFRHKTRHISFLILIPICLIMQCYGIWLHLR
ncbi:DUF1294 domain-containing protein [Brevibacillus sp. SYSU BS000544]|uniref:DUF1294 domain-containing protein n=1 Tax=Brevibacillus sp. SYSU BS000544 TaxID=3416443 RepID=UPI003CE59ED3